jgi:hypothetical protein
MEEKRRRRRIRGHLSIARGGGPGINASRPSHTIKNNWIIGARIEEK